MRFCSRAHLGFSVAIVAALTSRSAHAGSVDYRAADGCPSRAEVEARVQSQRDIRIHVARTKAGFRGEVSVGDGDHALARSVEARSCDGVIEALALVVALDRDGADAAAEQRDGPAAPVDPAPEQAHADSPAAPAPRAAAIGPGHDSPSVAPAAKERGSAAGAFGGTLLTTSFAQGAMLVGASAFAEIAATSGLGALSWARPSARAAFLRTTSTRWRERAGVAPDFTVTAGALDVCTLGWSSEDTLAFSACSRSEVGSLTAAAAGDDRSSTARWWLATGVLARARLVFSTRGAVRPMAEVSGGALATLIRDRFHFDGHETIVASPWLWTAAIGGGIELR